MDSPRGGQRHSRQYFFLDEKFNEQYRADEIQNDLLLYFSYLCVGISLLGLIGLSAFNAVQRTKEIVVRKVLGANLANIIFLLSGEVVLLVVLASILVMPLAYWVMNEWMDGFAFRTQVSYLLFGLVTFGAIGFACVTVIVQSLKSVRSNPVESLRQE